MELELVIFIGLQASGKSTFYQRHFVETHAYVSKDQFLNNKRPSQRQRQLVEEALGEGRSTVVDNTNPRPEDRSELIALGHMYGARVIGYYFEMQVKRSLTWNKQRIGKARVPDIAIFATVKKLTSPLYKEGFDQLYQVRVTESGQFEVLQWQEADTQVHDEPEPYHPPE